MTKSESSNKLHPCNFCRSSFKTKLLLKLHGRFHVRKKPFKYHLKAHAKSSKNKCKSSKNKVFPPLHIESQNKNVKSKGTRRLTISTSGKKRCLSPTTTNIAIANVLQKFPELIALLKEQNRDIIARGTPNDLNRLFTAITGYLNSSEKLHDPINSNMITNQNIKIFLNFIQRHLTESDLIWQENVKDGSNCPKNISRPPSVSEMDQDKTFSDVEVVNNNSVTPGSSGPLSLSPTTTNIAIANVLRRFPELIALLKEQNRDIIARGTNEDLNRLFATITDYINSSENFHGPSNMSTKQNIEIFLDFIERNFTESDLIRQDIVEDGSNCSNNISHPLSVSEMDQDETSSDVEVVNSSVETLGSPSLDVPSTSDRGDRFLFDSRQGKRFRCKFCYKSYRTRSALNNHVKKFTGRRNHDLSRIGDYDNHRVTKSTERTSLGYPLGLFIPKLLTRYCKYLAFKPEEPKFTDINDDNIRLPLSFTQFWGLICGDIRRQGDTDSELSSQEEDDDSLSSKSMSRPPHAFRADHKKTSSDSESMNNPSTPSSPVFPNICQMVVKWSAKRPISSVGLPSSATNNYNSPSSPVEARNRRIARVPCCLKKQYMQRPYRRRIGKRIPRVVTKQYDTYFNAETKVIMTETKPWNNFVTTSTVFYQSTDTNFCKPVDSGIVQANFNLVTTSNPSSNLGSLPMLSPEILQSNAVLDPALNATNPDGSTGPVVYQAFKPLSSVIPKVMNINHQGHYGIEMYCSDSNPQFITDQSVNSVQPIANSVSFDDSIDSVFSCVYTGNLIESNEYQNDAIFVESEEEEIRKRNKEGEAQKEGRNNVAKGCMRSDKPVSQVSLHNEITLRTILAAAEIEGKSTSSEDNSNEESKITRLTIPRSNPFADCDNEFMLSGHVFTNETNRRRNVEVSTDSTGRNDSNNRTVSKLNENKSQNTLNTSTKSKSHGEMQKNSDCPVEQIKSRSFVQINQFSSKIEVSIVNHNAPGCSFALLNNPVGHNIETTCCINLNPEHNSTCNNVNCGHAKSTTMDVDDVIENKNDMKENVNINTNISSGFITGKNVPQVNMHSDEILLRNLLAYDKIQSKATGLDEIVSNRCDSNLSQMSNNNSVTDEPECKQTRKTTRVCMITEETITMSNEHIRSPEKMSSRRFIVESNFRRNSSPDSSPKTSHYIDRTVLKLDANEEANCSKVSTNVGPTSNSKIESEQSLATARENFNSLVNHRNDAKESPMNNGFEVNHFLQFEPSNPTSLESSQRLLSWSKEHNYFKESVHDISDDDIDQAVEKSIENYEKPYTEIGILAQPQTEDKGCQVDFEDLNETIPCTKCGVSTKIVSTTIKTSTIQNQGIRPISPVEVISLCSSDERSSNANNSKAKDSIKRRLFDAGKRGDSLTELNQGALRTQLPQRFEEYQEISPYDLCSNRGRDSTYVVEGDSSKTNDLFDSGRKSTSGEEDDLIDQQVPTPSLVEDEGNLSLYMTPKKPILRVGLSRSARLKSLHPKTNWSEISPGDQHQ